MSMGHITVVVMLSYLECTEWIPVKHVLTT